MKKMKKHVVKFVFGALVAVAAFSAAVMLLWNALVPDIFGLGAISFWQSLGLLVLARLFFSGFGGNGRKFAGGFGRNPLREKWGKMTPEEREAFVKRHRHGFAGFARGFENHHFDSYKEEKTQD